MLLTSPLVIYPAAVMATTVAASAYFWFTKPGIFIRLLFRVSLYKAGLRLRYVMAGKYRYCYAVRGRPSPHTASLVLIHGFSASKDMWIPIVQRLPRHLHIIVVDLPGHGDTSTPDHDDDLSPKRYAQCLHEFLEAVDCPRPFHLVGTSLGGAMAIIYAAMYSEEVCKLTAICPAMKTPETTEFLKEVEAGHCRLIPNTASEMKLMMDSCMYHKVNINKQFLEGILQLRQPKNHFFTRLFEVVSDNHNHQVLMNMAEKVTTPTQVMWGREDELIHVSGAGRLQHYMTSIQRVDIFDDCGHSCNMDRPGLVVKCLLNFIRGQEKEETGRQEKGETGGQEETEGQKETGGQEETEGQKETEGQEKERGGQVVGLQGTTGEREKED